jgi:hypothetical protein
VRRPGSEAIHKLAQSACMHCHGTKCPLLTAFLLLLLLSLLLPLLFSQRVVIVGFQNFAWGFKLAQSACMRCHGTKSPLLTAFLLLLLLSLLLPLLFSQRVVIVGFRNFAWGFKSHKNPGIALALASPGIGNMNSF